MGQIAFEHAVEGRLLGRPHLLPVFDHPLKVPQRLREMNPAFYVVLNVVRVMEKARGLHYREWTPIPEGVTPRYNAWYEVRKLTAPPWWHQGFIIPFGALDIRTLRYVRDWDAEIHGPELIERIAEANRQAADRRHRDQRNLVEGLVRDVPWGKRFWGPGGPPKDNLTIRPQRPRRLYVPM